MSGKGTASSKKLKSDEPKEELQATWTQDFTDFVIILASGQEVKCHKMTLAQNSSIFATMFKSGLAECKTNKMKLDHFDDETVFHFLEYIYAKLERKRCEFIRTPTEKYDTSTHFYKRNFQKEKFTLDLYKMAHMYDTKDLLADCTEHLKATLTDENVMEVWKEASKHENAILREAVALHLKHSCKQNILEFLDAFERRVRK